MCASAACDRAIAWILLPFSYCRELLKGTVAVGRLRFNRLTHVPEFGDEVAFEAEHVENRVARLSRCMDDVRVQHNHRVAGDDALDGEGTVGVFDRGGGNGVDENIHTRGEILVVVSGGGSTEGTGSDHITGTGGGQECVCTFAVSHDDPLGSVWALADAFGDELGVDGGGHLSGWDVAVDRAVHPGRDMHGEAQCMGGAGVGLDAVFGLDADYRDVADVVGVEVGQQIGVFGEGTENGFAEDALGGQGRQDKLPHECEGCIGLVGRAVVLDVHDEVTVCPGVGEGSGHRGHEGVGLGNAPFGVDLVLLEVDEKNCVCGCHMRSVIMLRLGRLRGGGVCRIRAVI